jgi:hypothetical protein
MKGHQPDDDPGPHEDDDRHADWFAEPDDDRLHEPDGTAGDDVRLVRD